MTRNASTRPKFDAEADDYVESLQHGLELSGETPDYFARARIAWLQRNLQMLGARVESVVDYGCGIGLSLPHLHSLLRPKRLIGFDISRKSLEVASIKYRDLPLEVIQAERFDSIEADLLYANGLLHHIPPGERSQVVGSMFRAIRPGGYLSLWENNPWNPGTRWVMRKIPFDRDAIPITFIETRKLLRQAGFQILRTDFLFVFPRMLRLLRIVEPSLVRFPFGAQYQILCQKPDPK